MRYDAQLNTTPFVHFTTTMMTLAGASYFLHFLNNLKDMILLMNLVMLSLISLSTIPLFPQFMPNCSLTNSMISFSSALLSMYSYHCVLIVGNLLILAINTTSICTSISIQRIPPCTQDNNCLMQSPTFLPHLKCDMYKSFIILEL
jgi:hypothetical protein